MFGGRIVADGKPVGEIRTLSEEERLHFANETFNHLQKSDKIVGRQMLAMVTETCVWVQSYYTDSDGDFTVVSQRVCSYIVSNLDFYLDFSEIPTISDGGSHGGGSSGESGGSNNGGSKSPKKATPAPSNLPGENNQNVDPKKMMECFSNISNTNTSFLIRVFVVEPFPGTSFNVGPNSFGHVAISLTKTAGNVSITQTVGFYPTGSGLEKLNSHAQLLDNGDIQYNISASYSTNASSFQKVIDYISSPRRNYDFTEFNCSAFVYDAGIAGGVPIPDPTTQIGLGGAWWSWICKDTRRIGKRFAQ